MNKKVIKISIILAIIAILVFSFIVSQDKHHIETCHEHECVWCRIIHIAQNIINLFIDLIVTLVIGCLTYQILSRLKREKVISTRFSLVIQKVQLNE